MIAEGDPLLPGVVADMANPSWEKATARVLIVRLSAWRDLDVSTSHLVLFDEVRRSLPDAYLDFAFLPPARARKALDSDRKPWFQGRISERSPADFDLIMVSNAYALELCNLPYLFTTANLPLEAREREGMERAPIVILGGSNASASGVLVVESPVSGEPALESLVDGIFFGEGEDRAGPLAAILVEGAKSAGEPGPARRVRNLVSAASVPGFWPCLHAGGARLNLAAGRPRSLIRPLILNGDNASTARLSISAGCPGYCSFCLEGWDRSPYAEADLDRLLAEARAIKRSTGASDLELYSFNFNTHSRIAELIFELNRIFRHVSFMSQRLDILADSPGLMDIELAAGKRSFTLGVEGISSGMRAYYRKGLSDAQVQACAELCLRSRVRELKLFYIISGLETEEDLDEFAAFAGRLGALKKAVSPSTKVLVSAGFLVRLPFTPLQFAPLGFDASLLEGIGHRMRSACASTGIDFRLASDPEESFVDQALSLFGSTVRPWLLGIPEAGIVYETSLPAKAWASLKPFILKAGDAAALEKKADSRPPLAFVASPSRHGVLYRHYLEARNKKDRKSCLGASCSACGACENPGEVRAMTEHRFSIPGPDLLARRLRALLAAKDRFQALPAAVRLPESMAGANPAYRASWILRKLYSLDPEIEGLAFEARELFLVPGGTFPALFPGGSPWWGWTAFEFLGPSAASLASRLNKVAAPGISILGARPEPDRLFVEFGPTQVSASAIKGAFTAFCAARELSFTASRAGDGWKFEMTEGSIGRKLVASAWIDKTKEGSSLRLAVGGKTDLRPLAEALEKSSSMLSPPRILGWEGFVDREDSGSSPAGSA
jgi:hypothetical protein